MAFFQIISYAWQILKNKIKQLVKVARVYREGFDFKREEDLLIKISQIILNPYGVGHYDKIKILRLFNKVRRRDREFWRNYCPLAIAILAGNFI